MSPTSFRLIPVFMLAVLTGSQPGFAQTQAPVPAPAQAPAPVKSRPAPASPLAELQKKLETRLGRSVDSVTKLDYVNLYEVRVGTDVVYSDASADYLFVGNIIDMNTRVNLTKTRTDALLEASLPKIKFADLPLNSAIKIVKGNGKRQVAIFADPNCGFCKRLEKSIDPVTDVTMYVFLYPVLGLDSIEKSKAIWCSANRVKVWTDWMVAGAAIPSSANPGCSTPLDQNLELGKKLKVDGTPTMFFGNGKRVPGAVDLDEFNKLLAANG